MEDGDRCEARVRGPGLARPVEGEGCASGDGREPRGDGGTIREHGDRRGAHGGDGRGELLEEPRELELHPEGPQLRPVGPDAAAGLAVETEAPAPAGRRAPPG